MELTFWQQLLTVLDLFEIGLAVGASTFALTFYFMAFKKGAPDPSERRFMHAVYFTIRLSLVLIIATEIGYIWYYGLAAFPLVETSEVLWFRWFLLGVIIGNAVLMEFRKMPMWLGPALAGGSWYAFFFATAWPGLTLSFGTLTLYWALFIVFMMVLLRAIKRVYLKK
jgi:hypothetical protein